MTEASSGLWNEFRPSDETPWNLRRVHHLHRRAGLGASWAELQRDLQAGPSAAVDRVLQGGDKAGDFETVQRLIRDAAVGSGDINRLKAWWFYRMLYSGDALTERMTLMWHNHFATSNLKVSNVAMMWRQNEQIRKHALGKFGDLVRDVVKDPAMIVWLDANANRKGKPNENLARELMELFTLGVGHYTESDVKEVARALTGWTVRDSVFDVGAAYHDDGKKSVLSVEGNFDGDSVLDILLQQTSVATSIAKRLCEMFFGEEGVSNEQLAAIADGLRKHDLDIRWGVETILRSQSFFAEANIGNRVLDPVQFIINPLRDLEMTQPPPCTLLLAEWSAKLGQDLFYPPSVFGWPGGRSWLSTRTMIARANYVHSLAHGELYRPGKPLDINSQSSKYGFSDEASQARFMSELLLGHPRAADKGKTVSVKTLLKSAEMQLG